jgi:acetyl/propionyl-CoA carboxylase alpha subunit
MRQFTMMTEIIVDPGLWATSMLPEGCIEKWLVADGSSVEAGDPVASVRIESMLHDLMAPSRGRLQIDCKENSVIEPGTIVGHVVRQTRA